jgi:GH18 family chitinase
MKSLFILLSLVISISSYCQLKVVGYLPSYRWDKLDEIDYSHLSHVCASFANPDAEGNMVFEKDLHQFVKVMHQNGTKAVVSFCGGGNYSWGEDYKVYQTLLATPVSRTDFIHKIMEFTREYQLDGIDNDMEGKALELSTYNVFSQELADSLHAHGFEYSAALGVNGQWGAGLMTDETLNKLDFVMTMSYGGVGHWNWKQKPDEATFEKYQQNVNHFIERGHDPTKVIGGLPFYYTEYPKTEQETYNAYNGMNCSIYSNSIYKKQHPTKNDTLVSVDGNPIYINSFTTYKRKMDVAIINQSGFMIWEIGQDCISEGPSILKMMGKYLDSKNTKIDISGLENSISISKSTTELKISCPFFVQEMSLVNTKGEAVKSFKRKSAKVELSSLPKGQYRLLVKLSEVKSLIKEINI